MAGVQLAAGWNNNVRYLGASGQTGIEAAIASIKTQLIIIWVYRSDAVWYFYDPADLPGSTLTYLWSGEYCSINMRSSAYWDWTVPVTPTVTVSCNPTNGGTVSPGTGQYVGYKTFKATVNTNYKFKNWTVNGVTGSDTNSSLTLNIQANTTIVANFEYIIVTPTLPPEPWITNAVCPTLATTGNTITASFTVTNKGGPGLVCGTFCWQGERQNTPTCLKGPENSAWSEKPGPTHEIPDRYLGSNESTTFTVQFNMLDQRMLVYFQIGFRDKIGRIGNCVQPAKDTPNFWSGRINIQNAVYNSLIYGLSTIPATAPIGSTVSIDITVKNTGNATNFIRPWVKNNNVNISAISMSPFYALIAPGATALFIMQFTMPSYTVLFNLTTSHYNYGGTPRWVEDQVSIQYSITPTTPPARVPPAPPLYVPANLAQVGDMAHDSSSIRFEWGTSDPVNNKDSYRLVVSTNPNLVEATAKAVVNIAHDNPAGATNTTVLLPNDGTRYYWGVWSVSHDGIWCDTAEVMAKMRSFYMVGAPIPEAFTVNIYPATNVREGGATLNGRLVHLRPGSQWAVVWFEWGTSLSYGNVTPGLYCTADTDFSANLNGLLSNTTYHYRIAGKSGVLREEIAELPSNDMTFITTPIPGAGVVERMAAAKAFVDSLYQADSTYGYIKEYPGFPIGIYVRDTGDQRGLGDIRMKGPTQLAELTWLESCIDVSKISNIIILPSKDSFTVRFDDSTYNPFPDYNEPVLNVERRYLSNGSTEYYIALVSYSGSYHSDIYLGDTLLWANVGSGVTPRAVTVTTTKALPAFRCAIRHSAILGQRIYNAWGDTAKATKLAKLRSDFGYTCDIYDPMFGAGKTLDDNFMFTRTPYPDSMDVWRVAPRGLNPYRYPYLSRIQVDLDAYLLASRLDPLLQCLQAIHLLNKYDNPNYMVGNDSPMTIATYNWAKWNGVGIPSMLGSSSYGSGVRTAAFLVLATLLGYKYGVASMKVAANTVFDSMTGRTANQSGMYPMQPNYVKTELDGLLWRPPQQGSFWGVYIKTGDVVVSGTSTGIFSKVGMPSVGQIDMPATGEKDARSYAGYTDWLGMPPEDCGPIPGSQETTLITLQALRVYAQWVLGITYPSALELPSTTPNPIHKPTLKTVGLVPAYAKVGDSVEFSVILENLGTTSDTLQPWFQNSNVTFAGITPQPFWASVAPGGNATFTLRFTMPSSQVQFKLNANYWNGSAWVASEVGILYTVRPATTRKVFNVGVFYIWHGNDCYDASWWENITPTLVCAKTRIEDYMYATLNMTKVGESYVDAPIGGISPDGGGFIPPYEQYTEIAQALHELYYASPAGKWSILETYDLVIYVLSCSRGAFVVGLPSLPPFDWIQPSSSPIYIGDVDMRYWGCTYPEVEHEIFHCFGCPDHGYGPHTNLEYNKCIMAYNYELSGNYTATTPIRLCPECQAKMSWSNYKKRSAFALT